MIALILETIDRCSQWKSTRQLEHLIGDESASRWNQMISYLYLLLAAMIRGNRENCSQFAATSRLDWLVNRLEGGESSTGVLHVLHCVLIDSPEALNVIKEQHIATIISLIDKHGRDPKVLDILCSLCIGNDVAVRSNQNLICDNLLPSRDVLLQTRIRHNVQSMHPNVFVGKVEGSAIYSKWYYEAVIDHLEAVTQSPPHLRVGWASTAGYMPFPGAGEGWGCNGVGDDLFSYGFDGSCLWTAGKPTPVRMSQPLSRGDVIGVFLDLTIPQISFTVNGILIPGFFSDFNTDGMVFPVISLSSKVSVRFMLGGDQGKLRYGPPEDHSPLYESLLQKQIVTIQPCFGMGDPKKGILRGYAEMGDVAAFVPQPVNTDHIQCPAYVDSVRDKLAENIHELWAMGKIEQGWAWGEERDDYERLHPYLTNFERLPANELAYNISLAHETLKTILSLGYHMSYDPQYTSNRGSRLKYVKLGNNYLQANGYKPSPLDLSSITLSDRLGDLVNLLAENTHNVWAKERIRQGWTYGLTEDSFNKRSPHLVPYNKVDDIIKKANKYNDSTTFLPFH